jgi:ATP-dependent RNA helicase UAP56/SUB2
LYYCKAAEAEKNRKLNDLLDSPEFNQVVIFVSKVARQNSIASRKTATSSICIHGGQKTEERIESTSPSKTLTRGFRRHGPVRPRN